MKKFAEELLALSKKHGVVLEGKIRIREDGDYLPDTLSYEISDCVDMGGGVRDCSGTYLLAHAQRKPEPVQEFAPSKVKIDIIDYEKPMEGGIHSPTDGKYYSRRRDYETHLKDKGMHVVTDSPQRMAERRHKRIEEKKSLDKQSGNFAWI